MRALAEEGGLAMDSHTYGYVEESRSREICLGIAGKTTLAGFGLQGELNYQRLANHFRNDALTHIIGYYGLLSYRLPVGRNLSLTPYAMVERLRAIDSEHNPQHMFDGSFLDGFTTVIAGINLKAFGVGVVKLEYGYIKMNTVNEYSKYEDLYDINLINAQFSVAF